MDEKSNLINLTIDGIQTAVPKGTTVYTAAKQLGVEIPVFCYLDRMAPFGACRMCLVEVEKMAKLQASCTLEATEGMVVKTGSTRATEGREGILELLLINHPLDCPVCDRGGECPLQEHAFNHGPGKSKFFEEKRQFTKPYPLGPVLMLDRERCIQCARCTRFGDLLAGDHALEFIDRGFRMEVGTPNGEPAESKFIGNTIMICPVGALTSQVYRFRARPWDNDSTESTCTLCPVGCSLVLDSRDGEIMRTRSMENRDVNDIWLCDKGWFGYEFTYSGERLQNPFQKKNGQLVEISWNDAFDLIAEKISQAKPKGKIAAFGGNPLTTEENYLFQKLIREGAGSNHIDHRIGMPLLDDGITTGMEISLGECENLAYAILLGFDVTEELPVVWLRLRQAINKGIPVIFMGHYAPEIYTYLSKVVLHTPGAEVPTWQKLLPDLDALTNKGKGAIFVGSQYLASAQREELLKELRQFKERTPNLSINLMGGRGNSYGACFAGMVPYQNALGKPLKQTGLNCLQVLEESAKSGWDFLYVAGANPAAKYPSKLWKEARAKTAFMVVQDLFLTETARDADLVLPVLSFIEKGGNFINLEGRVQRLLPGKEVPINIFSDAEIFTQIAQRMNLKLSLDGEFLSFLKKGERVPKLQTQMQKTGNVEKGVTGANGLYATFSKQLFDNGVRMSHNPHLINLSKSPFIRMHAEEGARRKLQDHDLVRIQINGNSIVGKIKFDNTVAMSTVVIPLGFKELPTQELGANLLNGMKVEISKNSSS